MQISLSLCVWYMCGHVHRFRPILMATQTVLKLQLHLLSLILYNTCTLCHVFTIQNLYLNFKTV